MQFSVLMSVYKNDKAEYFKEAVESILNQTVPPAEIVLVRDGPVGEDLQNIIDKIVSDYPDIFIYVPLEENGGLGNALKLGLENCSYEIVARMDSDDISLNDRFEKQIKFLLDNPDVDIVGGNIAEFTDFPDNIIDYRNVPEKHEEIKDYLKKRNPFNHMTVMFKKSSVLNAGGYESFYLFEDYYLWVKMYLNGATFANLNMVLVNARISQMAKRRGGIKYYKSCKKLLKFMRNNGILSKKEYRKAKFIRFLGYVLLPDSLRKFAYKKYLRDKA